MHGSPSEYPFSEGFHDFILALDGSGDKSSECAAVLFVDDHVMGYIHETAGQITSIGCLQGRIGKTFTCTVGADEVLQHGHPFLKVGDDRVLDNLVSCRTGFLRLCHKSSHTAELLDLLCRTSGT